MARSPQEVNAAHLRIFLEPWATVQSGQAVEFDQLPDIDGKVLDRGRM
jgi:hypothetical protein